MNSKEFDVLKIDHLVKKDLRFACDRSNYIDGWDDCIRELEKYSVLKLQDILNKIIKERN